MSNNRNPKPCCVFLDLVGTSAAIEIDTGRYMEMLDNYVKCVDRCAKQNQINYVGFSDLSENKINSTGYVVDTLEAAQPPRLCPCDFRSSQYP